MRYDHLIGLPYDVNGGDCKKSFDCSSLVRYVTGINIANMPSNFARFKDKTQAITAYIEYYKQIDKPIENCIVTLGKVSDYHHIGVWVEGGVLHATQNGVAYSNPKNLKDNGFWNIKYWVLNENN